MELPKEWEITDAYNSHRPLVYFARKQFPNLYTIEFGCGDGLTPLLDEKDTSFENDPEWSSKYPGVILVDDWFSMHGVVDSNILFVDNRPGESRKDILASYANCAEIIILHDSERTHNHYGVEPVLEQFRWRCNLYPKDLPGTTAVSNFVDVTSWRGAEIGPYKIS